MLERSEQESEFDFCQAGDIGCKFIKKPFRTEFPRTVVQMLKGIKMTQTDYFRQQTALQAADWLAMRFLLALPERSEQMSDDGPWNSSSRRLGT